MARNPITSKGRRNGATFLALPHNLIRHENYCSLSGRATKMLITLAGQYNGSNNGDLTAAMSVVRKLGWNSNDQIRKALDELLEANFIVLTRQGRRPKIPSLYAITWQSIDECGGKLEVSPSRKASNKWRNKLDPEPRRTVQSTPQCGAIEGHNVVSLNRGAVL